VPESATVQRAKIIPARAWRGRFSVRARSSKSSGLGEDFSAHAAWNVQNHSISPENDEVRQLFTDWIAELCEDDEALLRKVVPRYPVGAKGILLVEFWRRTREVNAEDYQFLPAAGS